MKLLQVCNVGRIVGGTAACAWTVTRALPDIDHAVVCLSSITPETRTAFAPVTVEFARQIDDALLRRHDPDLVLLHNVAQSRWSTPAAVPVIQYAHSLTTHARAELTGACSAWLAKELRRRGRIVDGVLLQAVPRPPRLDRPDPRSLRGELVIGRLCTPVDHKWPDAVVAHCRLLAEAVPEATWEFVGAPALRREALTTACGGRAVFHDAGWNARSHLWNWDVLLYHHPTLAETFGRTVAEALRSGCIPIVDDRGGFREQIVEGTGSLCATPADFVAALRELQSPEQRGRRSRACRSHGDQLFALERFREDLLRWFRVAAKATDE